MTPERYAFLREALKGVGDPGSGLGRAIRRVGLDLATTWSHGAINKKIARYAKMKKEAQKAGNNDAVAYWEGMIKKAKERHKDRAGAVAGAYVKGAMHSVAIAGVIGAVLKPLATSTDDPKEPLMHEHRSAALRRLVEVTVPKPAADLQGVVDDLGETFHDLKVLHDRPSARRGSSTDMLRDLLEALRQVSHKTSGQADTFRALVKGVAQGQAGSTIQFLDSFLTACGVNRASLTIKADWVAALSTGDERKFRLQAQTLMNYCKSLELLSIPNRQSTGYATLLHIMPGSMWLPKGSSPWVQAAVPAFVDVLADSIAWIEKKMRATPADEFAHGPWTVVPMDRVSQKDLDACLKALDAATDLCRSKFPELLYGKVFLAKRLQSKGGGKTLASYVPSQDTMNVSTLATKTATDVEAILHELGHRFFHLFWKNDEAKREFMELSSSVTYEKIEVTREQRNKLADEYVAWVLQAADRVRQLKAQGATKADIQKVMSGSSWSKELTVWFNMLGKRWPMDQQAIMQHTTSLMSLTDYTTQKVKIHDAVALAKGPDVVEFNGVKKQAMAVSAYGATDWHENFSEAFAYALMGKAMPVEIKAIMDKLPLHESAPSWRELGTRLWAAVELYG